MATNKKPTHTLRCGNIKATICGTMFKFTNILRAPMVMP
jgi:hypothetical protein